MKKLSFCVSFVLVSFLHPISTLAMNMQGVVQVAKGMAVGGNFLNYEQHGVLFNAQEEAARRQAESSLIKVVSSSSLSSKGSGNFYLTSSLISEVARSKTSSPLPNITVTSAQSSETQPANVTNSARDQDEDTISTSSMSTASVFSARNSDSFSEAPCTITKSMLDQEILQAEVTSKYATDTINIIEEIYKIINSPKNYNNAYVFSDAWEKVVVAKVAIAMAQENIENRLKQLDILFEKKAEDFTFYHYDAPLFIALDLAIDTVKESVQEAIIVAERIKKDPHYKGDVTVLNLLETLRSVYASSFNFDISHSPSIASTLLKISDIAPKQSDFEMALRHAKATTIYAADIREAVHVVFRIFNGGQFADHKDLNDIEDACKAVDAATVVVATIEKKTEDCLNQLDNSLEKGTTSDRCSLDHAKLLEYQNIATAVLKGATEKARSVAERIKNYQCPLDAEELLEEFAKMEVQFLESYHLQPLAYSSKFISKEKALNNYL